MLNVKALTGGHLIGDWTLVFFSGVQTLKDILLKNSLRIINWGCLRWSIFPTKLLNV